MMDDDDLFAAFMSQYAAPTTGSENIPRSFLYSDEAYTGIPEDIYSNEGRNYPTSESTQGPGGSPVNASMATGWDKLLSNLKNMGGKAMDFAGTPQGLTSLLLAALAASDRRRAGGGGTGMAYQGPANIQRTMAQGKYGPIARYAAEGGLMQAYAHGGEAQAYAGGKPLMMEDGGFVFTADATRKLKPEGIAALGGKMISAPGNGTDDKGITGIIGKNGVTPARVSNKESYFTKAATEANGGPRAMHAKMKHLERKA